MKRHLLSAATSILGLALIQSPVTDLQAAELNVLAGGAMTGPMQELGTQFERASGHKLGLSFRDHARTDQARPRRRAVRPWRRPCRCDERHCRSRQFAAEPTTDIARVGLGVAVRAGAPKPDISTPDALKQTLLKAQSIASILESATGYQLLQVCGEIDDSAIRPQHGAYWSSRRREKVCDAMGAS